MNHAFLFGAGASYGSGNCHPYAPPLGKQLFKKLLPTLRVGDFIDEDIKDEFTDFEKAMDLLLQRNLQFYQSFQQDLARYFAKFEPINGNRYIELIECLAPYIDNVLLSTLNYDILLERAIEIVGFDYWHLMSGNPNESSFSVYKLHGSCNIVPDSKGSFSNLIFVVDPSNNSQGVGGTKVKSLGRNELYYWLDNGTALVPCIAAYHPTKHIRDHAAPFLRLRQKWAEQIHVTDELFIIGVGLVLHDEHIWEPISKYKGKVHWVGGGSAEAMDWAKGHGVDLSPFADKFESFMPKYKAYIS